MADASVSDSDSDGSHISSTPPRNPPLPYPPPPPISSNQPSSKTPQLAPLPHRRPIRPANSSKARPRSPPRAAYSPVDFQRTAPKRRCSIGDGRGDGLPAIVFQSYGGGCNGGPSESFRAASHVSGRSSISELAKSRNLSLQVTTDRNDLDPSIFEESERMEKKATSAQCDGVGGGRGVRGLPNLVTAPVPLPTVCAKGGKEGNFVKLNINGYGRRKFGKSGRKGKVSGKYGRRTKGKARSVSVSDAGFVEEDGLVLQNLPSKDKMPMVLDESVNEAIAMAREDLSDRNLMKLLKLTHGYDSFRDGQLVAIKQIIDGKSTMLVLPTSAGKSLCYQIPALILPGVTLVISPLVALMVDQLKRLPPILPGGLLSSNQTYEEGLETFDALVAGRIKVLFVSPERLMKEDFISKCEMLPLISLVVIDEAHCLSEWSHNFRPSYLRIRSSLLQTRLNSGCILAMTATATIKTLHSIMSVLEIPLSNLIQSSQMRENLQLSVTSSGNRMKDLITLMKTSPLEDVKSIIVYCKFQSEADAVSKYLCDNNIRAKSYHSGIPAKDRNRIQELFCSNKLRVVVATVAFGMGLDKSDVGAVIHYSLPGSIEEYVQEIGRAGRGGKLSYCHLLLDDPTYLKLRSLSYSEGVDQYSVNKLLSQIFIDVHVLLRKVCSIVKDLASRKFDMKEEVILTVLTYLEIGEVQYLQLLPQLNVTCNLQFHKSSITDLSTKDEVVATILKRSNINQGSYVFDIPTVANSMGTTVTCILNHLYKLKIMGEITYVLKDPAYCYTVVRFPDDFCSLASYITKWLSDVENCKVKKLDEMYNAALFAAKKCPRVDGCCESVHTSCLQKKILHYFKDDENGSDNSSSRSETSCSRFLHADIKVFLKNNSNIKFTPRAVTRIMHGISSPAFPTMTWSNCHFWGRYSGTDFSVVMKAATIELRSIAGNQ